MSRIYITGVAKSGTTLLKRMFFAFKDVAVVNQEISIYDFHKMDIPENKNLVGKRSTQTLFGCASLPQAEREQQINLLKDCIVINIVRHPHSVLRSYWRDFNVDGGFDWVYSMRETRKYNGLIHLNIKYEDLIKNPDAIQQKISNLTGLEIKHKFSEYPSFYPDINVDMQENYKARKLETIEIPKMGATIIDPMDFTYEKYKLGYE